MAATTNLSHLQKKLENLGGMFRDEFFFDDQAHAVMLRER